MTNLNHNFFLLLGILLLPDVAFGYIDPGAGYLIWQVVVGAFVGSFFFAKKIATGFQRVFRRSRTTK